MKTLSHRITDAFDRGATLGAFVAVVGVLVVGVGLGSFVSCKSSSFIIAGIGNIVTRGFDDRAAAGAAAAAAQ